MGKIAFDIALLLPEELEDLCIRLNQENKRKRPLAKDDYRPHISLAMGIIDEKDLESIQKFLINLNIPILELSVDSIKYKETLDGDLSIFNISRTEALQALHENIMNHVMPYLQKGASSEMLFEGDQTGISDSSKKWLDTFSEKTAYGDYWPHITLNCFDVKVELPIKFKVNTFGLFHVGNGVTCRKLISSYKLFNQQ